MCKYSVMKIQNKDGIGASHQTGELTNDKRITFFNFNASSDIKLIIVFTGRQQSLSTLVDFIKYFFLFLSTFAKEKIVHQ